MPLPVAVRSMAWVYGQSVAGISGSNPSGGMDVCLLWLLLGRDLCDGQVTRPEESYWVWCVWVWSWNFDNEEALAHYGLLHHGGGGGWNISCFPATVFVIGLHDTCCLAVPDALFLSYKWMCQECVCPLILNYFPFYCIIADVIWSECLYECVWSSQCIIIQFV